MKFNELNDLIPYAKGGKEKILRFSPYPNITLAMPGRHAADTIPVGGDFVVMVTDAVFKRPDHQFTHTDIFKDIEVKSNHPRIETFMASYFGLIHLNKDTDMFIPKMIGCGHYLEDMPDLLTPLPGVDEDTFLQAVQCLAVAE